MAEHSLRIRRLSCGATLREVADIVGVNDVRIHRWEMSKSQPSGEFLGKWRAAIIRLEAQAARRVAEAKERA